MNYEIIQSEKAFRSQEKNTFVIVFKDNLSPNKIQVSQLLKQSGFTPLSVNKVISHRKTKSKNGRRSSIRVKRPTKYYVTLKSGETLINEIKE